VSYNVTNPGLKPRAILCSRFAANLSQLGNRPFKM
jgi:hypothetical protein